MSPSSRAARRLLPNPISLGATLVALLSGCAPEAPGPEPLAATVEKPEKTETVASPLIVPGGQDYAAYCASQGVPTPPQWGGYNDRWTDNDVFVDSYTNFQTGRIFYSQVASASAPGLCVVSTHSDAGPGSVGLFDLICQGKNGKACFWEEGRVPAPPDKPVSLTGPGGYLAPGLGCTNCHVGKNAFMTHFGPEKHPTNLATLTDWMPSMSAWYQPIMNQPTDPQNPPPDPLAFADYPASSSNCLSCHADGKSAGPFPPLASPGIGGATYCKILTTVTSRSGLHGGMPPNVDCDPDAPAGGHNPCPSQVDPFVIKMLAACGVPAPIAGGFNPETPVAMRTSNATKVSPFVNNWDHVLFTDPNARRLTQLDGVNGSEYFTTTYAAPLGVTYGLSTPTMWVNGASGNALSIAARSESGPTAGHILVKRGTNTVEDATVIAGAPSAKGAPFAYTDHQGKSSIVYRGADSNVYQLNWDTASSKWVLESPGGPAANGDPIGFDRGDSAEIVYVCGSGRICELRKDVSPGTQWKAGVTSVKVKANREGTRYIQPVPVTTSYSLYIPQNFIFYAADDGVHELDVTSASFVNTPDRLVFADAGVDSLALPVAFTAENNLSVVFISRSSAHSFLNELTAPGTSPRVYTRKRLFTGDVDANGGGDGVWLGAADYVSSSGLDTITVVSATHKLHQFRRKASAGAYAETILN